MAPRAIGSSLPDEPRRGEEDEGQRPEGEEATANGC